ncbi:metal ABC transporter solute-binding protein, Zn/Mn family [Paenibacillus sacheonensis]|uniref:Zinc ABC transporter solute-binding protein n=1 Tax=Paenibacillus sacheonensis TaxID=742054 RepID=A0A7X4YUI7_9BACL|nr:zinc ABC transporter substrate-binding protein [Paenibacillus sacheonensis]MBM7567244.1 manganese/zinc/iron transport system substrate-binding protein [Paenibacillus sacheonensis]NBC72860.1 zinc ABC transporter solute-binding protein [Paenibacillus sacheonensis]
MEFPANARSGRRLRRLFALICLGCLSIVTACGNTGAQEDGHAVKVTATIGMIADVVRQIGGEHVEVTGLMKAGVDPHLYKASQGDIRKLDKADIIFYNGLHLEGKMVEIFEKMAKEKTTVAVSDNIDRAALRTGAENGMANTEYDPHIWFNVQHWMTAAESIRDTLVGHDPEHAADYRRNAEAYLEQLQQLHDDVTKRLNALPEESRILVTAHDAFGYFGDAYRLQVKALQGMSTASEAGTKDVTDLRDYLVDNKIKAVFIESSVPRKAIDAVIQGAKQKGHDVVIGGQLFSDAMGEEGTPEGTYIGMVRHNVDTIAAALK